MRPIIEPHCAHWVDGCPPSIRFAITTRADQVERWRLTAGYVDSVLRGEEPADVPIQAPTKYELAIDLKIAKALGLAVPTTPGSPPTR